MRSLRYGIARAGRSVRDRGDGGVNGVRLTLTGELDLAVAEQLRVRLEDLAHAGATVTLDLSQLDFIDSSGLNVLITYYRYAAREGWILNISPRISGEVERVIRFASLDTLFWP